MSSIHNDNVLVIRHYRNNLHHLVFKQHINIIQPKLTNNAQHSLILQKIIHISKYANKQTNKQTNKQPHKQAASKQCQNYTNTISSPTLNLLILLNRNRKVTPLLPKIQTARTSSSKHRKFTASKKRA